MNVFIKKRSLKYLIKIKWAINVNHNQGKAVKAQNKDKFGIPEGTIFGTY